MSSEDVGTRKISKSFLWMDPMFTSVVDVQKRIRSQSYGRRTKTRQSNRERTLSNKYADILRCSSSELNIFFNQSNNQMMRMSRSQTLYGTNNSIQDESDDPPVTLGDICSVVSHVANKITEKKNSLDLLRGFRLPSTKLDPINNQPKKMSTIRKLFLLFDIIFRKYRFHYFFSFCLVQYD